MSDHSLPQPGPVAAFGVHVWRKQRPWLAFALVLLAVALLDPAQVWASVDKVAGALVSIAPFLTVSILIAAWAGATGADNLIARAFTGAPAMMIMMGALAGGLSPFCSCGVIPLIAALLAIGVPLAPVMAFWLASPLMDPSMFVLTAGVLGLEFAIAKTLIAVGMGVMGGTIVHLVMRAGGLTDPLREGIGNGGCGGAKVRAPTAPVWRFWQDPTRLTKFRLEGTLTFLFLLKWMSLAFLLESLMLAYVPAELVTQTLGGNGLAPIAIATFVGVPAYFNGYAALPLIGTLMEQGMQAGAGMAFLIAGGVTSLPAAIAVWALVRFRVFALYIAISLGGAFTTGLMFHIWTML
ncbi:permease [Roseinatronobacter sp. S2]|uniref:permease n=1 Tax=Roseinatronobacter sp. S2 TaxID=3035471 RepID=UPI00240EC06F|nr:permease [Roseinatronobacter sp. S2]WFE74562.1 permease [Roseinatronobacter sp. S2]